MMSYSPMSADRRHADRSVVRGDRHARRRILHHRGAVVDARRPVVAEAERVADLVRGDQRLARQDEPSSVCAADPVSSLLVDAGHDPRQLVVEDETTSRASPMAAGLPL